MKKTLIAILLVLMTLTLFVACADPSADDTGSAKKSYSYVLKLEFEGVSNVKIASNTFYVKSDDDHTTNNNEYHLYSDTECLVDSGMTVYLSGDSSLSIQVYEGSTPVWNSEVKDLYGATIDSGAMTVNASASYFFTAAGVSPSDGNVSIYAVVDAIMNVSAN